MSLQKFDPAAYKAGQRRDWTEAAGGWRKWWRRVEAMPGPGGDRLIQLAAVRAGHRVLDIATGIGEPALTAARVVGPAGSVVGTDISPGMLEVARERAASSAWGSSKLGSSRWWAGTQDAHRGAFEPSRRSRVQRSDPSPHE